MKLSQLRQLIREEISEAASNPLKELVSLLNQAKSLAKSNIGKADNFDLEDLSYKLEEYIDELNGLGKFETYDED
jgi:hypothetical protein